MQGPPVFRPAAQPSPGAHPAPAPFAVTHWVRDAWDGVFADLRAARDSIDFEQYIVGNDATGHALIDLCAAKAAEGVRVRVLLDAIGCRKLRASGHWKSVVEAGGEVRFYNVLTLRHLLRWPPVVHRDHRKAVVIDGRIGWVGGACFEARMRDWRDTMIRLEGAEVGSTIACVRCCFDAAWRRAVAFDRRVAAPDDAGAGRGTTFQYVVNAPRPPHHRALYEALTGQVRNAQGSLRLTTPYFVPDHRFMRELIDAHRRGVTVTLMVPAVSDHPPMDVLSRAFSLRMSRAGITVRYFRPRMLHAKTAIIDDTLAFAGSLNLDRLSFRINVESAVVSRDPAFVAALTRQFEADLEDCQEDQPTVAWNRVLDPVLRLIGRWL